MGFYSGGSGLVWFIVVVLGFVVVGLPFCGVVLLIVLRVVLLRIYCLLWF